MLVDSRSRVWHLVADMNLYFIKRKGAVDYDQYDSAVVAAPNEEAARNTHPDGYSAVRDEGAYGTWVSPDKVEVKLIGEAAPKIKGVVCASFNAG